MQILFSAVSMNSTLENDKVKLIVLKECIAYTILKEIYIGFKSDKSIIYPLLELE